MTLMALNDVAMNFKVHSVTNNNIIDLGYNIWLPVTGV